MFERRSDGIVRMTFRPPPTAPEELPRLSFTYSAMVTAVQTAPEKLPIAGFNSEGYHVYPAKLNGHFLWDSPRSGNCDPDCFCWDDWEEDDVEPQRRRKPKKKIPKTLCSHNQTKPPHNPPPPPSLLAIYQKNLDGLQKIAKLEFFHISKMAAWTDLQMLRANATPASVLRELLREQHFMLR